MFASWPRCAIEIPLLAIADSFENVHYVGIAQSVEGFLDSSGPDFSGFRQAFDVRPTDLEHDLVSVPGSLCLLFALLETSVCKPCCLNVLHQ